MRTRFSPVLPTPEWRPAGSSDVWLQLGGVLITGTPLGPTYEAGAWFTSLSGWWDAPSSTGQTTQFLLADGGWNDRAFRTPRVIEIEGHVEADSRPELRDALDRLMAAIPVDEQAPFVVSEDGLQRYCMVRMSGDPKVTWEHGSYPIADFNIQLVASDPRRLAGTGPDDGWRVYGPTTLPSSTGGWTFPVVLPKPINAVTTTGQFRIESLGTGPASAVVEFHGPVVGPAVTELATGRKLWFDLTLAATDTLTVDLSTGASARQVLLNGVSRRGKARGEWFTVTGGQTLQFGAGAYNADATMTVRVKDVWI